MIHAARDHGDFYYNGADKVALLRYHDQFVVRIAAAASKEDVVARLTSLTGPLRGYEVSNAFNDETIVLSRKLVSHGNDSGVAVPLAAVRNTPGVAWATPLFKRGENGTWVGINDELVVQLKPGISPSEFFGADFKTWRPLRGTSDQFVGTLAAGAGLETLELANRLHFDPRVEWASPNAYDDVRQFFIPNDTLFADQWNLHNTGHNQSRSDADSDAVEAWDTTRGSSDTVIAVLDDGVQTNHPDLNIWTNPGEIAGNGVDDDGNGWIDDVNGWNFSASGAGNNNVNPSFAADRHGTAVAGVAAAEGNNSLGVSGMSHNAKIMPLKVFQNGIFAGWDRAAEALYYAAGRTATGGTWDAADVINLSFGNTSITSNSFFDLAVNYAANTARSGKGVPIFASAGNSADSTVANRSYRTYTLNGIPAGNWTFEWRFSKDASITQGDDTAWLAYVQFPNNTTVEQFDTLGLPSQWTTSGNAVWSVVDDPAHSYGTGRYVARAGDINDNQTVNLRSPTITVSATSSLQYRALVSAQPITDANGNDIGGDGLRLYASNNGGASWSGPFLFGTGVPNPAAGIAYPANLTSTIAVGASADWDYRSHYSQYGTALDFVASSSGGYGAVWTTDRTGEDGYNATGSNDAGADSSNDLNYTSTFGGTSAAAPLAAGIGALMLSRNPNLSASDIRTIMRNTADKIGGNTGATAYSNGFNQYYGYGRANANGAVDKAWSLFVPSTPDLVNTSDWGFSETDNKTFDTTPTITGTAPAGSHVWIYVDGVVRDTVQLGPGVTMYTRTLPTLSTGLRNVTVKVAENSSIVEADRSQFSNVLQLNISNSDSLALSSTFSARLSETATVSGSNSGTSTLAISWAASPVALTKTGTGTVTIGVNGISNRNLAVTYNNQNGTTNFDTDTGVAATQVGHTRVANWSINASLGTGATSSNVVFNTTQNLAAISVAGTGALAKMPAHGSRVLVVDSVAVTSGGKLDLFDNDMILRATSSNEVTRYNNLYALIVSGYNSGAWNGTGVMSTSAGAAGGSTALAIVRNSRLLPDVGVNTFTTFSGQLVSEYDILVKYTYTADPDITGLVDDADVTIMSAMYDPTGSGMHWWFGDSNYDGVVDDNDITFLGANYDPNGTPL